MSCFGGESEQIYMVEVLVHKLTLTKGKMKDIGDHPISIKVKFLNFPVFEITQNDFYSLEPMPPEEDGTLYFMIGRSCLFVMVPKELVRQLQSTVIHVGVFRLSDTFPTAETEISLPGCLCDQVAMAQNDVKNLPKPFTVKGRYNLLDPGENPSGRIEMEMRLLCFGKSITTHYELHPSYFLFRNNGHDREYCVRRLVPPSYHPDGIGKKVTEYGDLTTSDELKEKEKEEVRLSNQSERGGKKGKSRRKK